MVVPPTEDKIVTDGTIIGSFRPALETYSEARIPADVFDQSRVGPPVLALETPGEQFEVRTVEAPPASGNLEILGDSFGDHYEWLPSAELTPRSRAALANQPTTIIRRSYATGW